MKTSFTEKTIPGKFMYRLTRKRKVIDKKEAERAIFTNKISVTE